MFFEIKSRRTLLVISNQLVQDLLAFKDLIE